jgi:hypothetical protein
MGNLLAQPRAGHCRHGPVRCSTYRFRPALCVRVGDPVAGPVRVCAPKSTNPLLYVV